MTHKILTGHDTLDNAYVVADYPYGFTLRTKIRYWVETNERFGQRFVSQTLKPGTDQWNRSKASTYTTFVVLFIDDTDNRLYWAGWNPYQGPAALREFIDRYGFGLSEERRLMAYNLMNRYDKADEARKGK